MSTTTTAAKRQLSDNNSQGTTLGQSTTDKISFYGVTCVAQQASIGATAVSTTAATTTTPWGFSTSTQANAVVSVLNAIQSALTTLGLIAGT